jgi:predicted enzyme related to lactoylglutathione lyase
MPAPLNRVLLYVKDIDAVAQFYTRHFGYVRQDDPDDRITELVPQTGGVRIMLHPAAKSGRTGQTQVKLVFDVADVTGFCDQTARDGLVWGPVHRADGYEFANAKDPAHNSISVSSRAFRKTD